MGGATAAMVTPRPTTVSDIERMGADGQRQELIDGVLQEKVPVSGRHGEIEFEIGGPLHAHVKRNGLGRVYPSDTQFVILRDPDVIHTPDIAFVRADRLPPEDVREGIMPLAPDLVVEVISLNDRYVEVIEKVDRYRRADVALVWLVQPRRRAVEVHLLGQEPRLLRESDALDGGDLIPGFRLSVAEIFR